VVDSQKVIVSLDGIPQEKALQIANLLKGSVWGFKVNDLIYEELNIIDQVKKLGNIFVDIKLYDIPNTVANSVRRLSARGVDIITVHASGGIEMMRTAKAHAGATKIIAVTVLTSHHPEHATERVKELAEDAVEAGVDGVVCSGHELETVNIIKGMSRKLKIVPGIRPYGYEKSDDQIRTTTPEEAVRLGADYLVVGRPITQSDSPAEALKRLCAPDV
jgi:orotidine-5'-phosphate decarboxylase